MFCQVRLCNLFIFSVHCSKSQKSVTKTMMHWTTHSSVSKHIKYRGTHKDTVYTSTYATEPRGVSCNFHLMFNFLKYCNIFLYFMCLFVGLGVCMCTICVQCPPRPEESIKSVSPEAGATDWLQACYGCWESNQGPRQEQPASRPLSHLSSLYVLFLRFLLLSLFFWNIYTFSFIYPFIYWMCVHVCASALRWSHEGQRTTLSGSDRFSPATLWDVEIGLRLPDLDTRTLPAEPASGHYWHYFTEFLEESQEDSNLFSKSRK